MEVNLVMEAVKFLILGMSTVFMFLILMVFVLQVQAKILMKYFPPKEEKVVVNGSLAKQLSKKDNLAVVAAIAVSLQSYKKQI